MANPNGNRLFRFEWQSIVNNYKFKLEVIASDASEDFTGSPIIIDMPPESLNKCVWKWDNPLEYPLGNGSAPVMIFNFNVNETAKIGPNGVRFNDVIKDPVKNYGNYHILFEDLNGLLNSGFEMEYTTGNIYNFYVDFSSEDPLDDYRLMYTGIQKKGIESGYESSDYSFEIETLHISRAVYETIVVSDFFYYYNNVGLNTTVRTSHAYFELLNWDAVNNITIAAGNKISLDPFSIGTPFYWFLASSMFHILFREHYFKILRIMSRNTVIGGLPFPTPFNSKIYDQSDRDDNELGPENFIVPGTWMLGWRGNKDKSGILDPDFIIKGHLFSSMGQDIKTGWDLIQHEMISKGRKGIFTATALIDFNILTTDSVDVLIEDFDVLPKILMEAGTLKRSSATPIETIDNDLTKVDKLTPSSQAEATLTIPVPINSMPSAVDASEVEVTSIEEKVQEFNFNSAQANFLSWYWGEKEKNYNYYYFGRPKDEADHFLITESMPIMIHEFWDLELGAGLFYSDIFPFSSIGGVDYPSQGGASKVDMGAYNSKRQINSLPTIMAKLGEYLFGQDSMNVVEGKANIKSTTAFNAVGDSYGLNWMTPTKYLNIPLDSLNPPNDPAFLDIVKSDAPGNPTKAYLIESSINFTSSEEEPEGVSFTAITLDF